MSKDHSGTVRGFHWSTRAWYGKSALRRGEGTIDEVNFGMFGVPPSGGTTGEMMMVWVNLGGGPPVPQLRVFCDGWHALASFGDLLAAMAEVDSADITPQQFVDMLKACGFRDFTAYESPYASNEQTALRRDIAALERDLETKRQALAVLCDGVTA